MDLRSFDRLDVYRCRSVHGYRAVSHLACRRPGRDVVNSNSTTMDEKERKSIHLLRHGETEMNVYMYSVKPELQRSPDSVPDPLLYDSRLTEKGKQESRSAAGDAEKLDPAPQILISSPLSRALQTAELAFPDFQGPRLVHSLARERTYFASDVGVARSKLEKLWPNWSFAGVEEEIWWLSHTDLKGDPKAVIAESYEHFRKRMEQLRQYLLQRPEKSIAVVVHRDVIEILAGYSPKNGEFHTMSVGA